MPIGVLAGINLDIATEVAAPGDSTTEFCERFVLQFAGSREATLNVLAEHPAESLFVTVIVWLTEFPA